MAEAIHFRDFEVFETTGFASELPDSLPDYFLPWHQLALKTVELMTSQSMRQETEKLPLLDSSRLEKYEDLRLAYLQLTVISSGYAWERGPEQLPE
ncbi:myoglobin-like, partial [Physella acuta]|uniref:myoglobin-like n=1 Tax=Physella acuta TaxID=109671 RepID=UPI0027DAE2D4